MDEKDLEAKKESKLDFEEAKDLTVGQAKRRKEELEAGVTEEDNVLDKYIKQHREEIEAGKFAAKSSAEAEEVQERMNELGLDDFIKEVREDVTEARQSASPVPKESASQTGNSAVSDETIIASAPLLADDEAKDAEPSQVSEDAGAETKVIEPLSTMDTIPVTPVQEPSPASQSVSPSTFEDDDDEEPTPFYKQKKVLYSVAGVFLIVAIAGTAYLTLNRNQSRRTTTSSSTSKTSKSSSSSSSSSSDNQDLKAFNDLYDSFFTDANKLALKNSSFGNLEKLKAALDKLEGTSEHTVAKAKYDSLVKQISAIQTVNSQFNSAAITDGVLDTNAKVKNDATFPEAKTGNSDLDKVLNAAISLGKSQLAPAAPAPQTGDTASAASPSAPATSNNTNAAPSTSGGAPTIYGGLPSTGVNLQRNLSRVPYNQSAIDDVNNPAWTFNEGILEKILATSRERGYITGDQFILERVNIINGTGYYNLFKPDGTYLFSINCKTGYFVGNGPGYADSLDF